MKRRLVSLLCVISVIIAICPTALALTPQEDMARMDQVIALIEQKGLDYGGEDVLRRGLEEMFRRDPESFDLLMDSILSSYDPTRLMSPPAAMTRPSRRSTAMPASASPSRKRGCTPWCRR